MLPMTGREKMQRTSSFKKVKIGRNYAEMLSYAKA
jgi:hypothetical protein